MRATVFFMYLCLLLFGSSSLHAGNGCQFPESKPIIAYQQDSSVNIPILQTAFEENKGPFWEQGEFTCEDLDDDEDEKSTIAKKGKPTVGFITPLTTSSSYWHSHKKNRVIVPFVDAPASPKYILQRVIRI